MSSAGDEPNETSWETAISADGRYVAFASDATNLVPDDTNGMIDVFVHDQRNRATERISISATGNQADGGSYSVAISADGRYVAFASDATNLVPDDTNGTMDVFVHDQRTGTIERVSISTTGTQTDNLSFLPELSANGRYVTFLSSATNLVPGDTNGVEDVFLHDRRRHTTRRVSVSSAGTQSDGESGHPEISEDGRYLAYSSTGTNLVPGDTNGMMDVFVHDQRTGTTERVSVSTTGGQADEYSYYPALNANGRYVAFNSHATNLVRGDTNGDIDIFLHDRSTNRTVLISGPAANGRSIQPTISADGRHVAYSSTASNLAPGDTNGVSDAFIHDRRSGTTERVSVSSAGLQGDDISFFVSVNANGRYVAFISAAGNLAPGDTNGLRDVYLRDRGRRN